MADITKQPEHQLRLEQIGSGLGNLASNDNPVCVYRPALWPFSAEDYSPLAWWRRLPPNGYGKAERLLLATTLRGIGILHGGGDMPAAMKGDASAALNAAMELMPIEKITLQTDIVMSALLRVALNGSATGALVMAQIVGLTEVGHELSTEIASLWLDYGEQHSNEPHKFGEARNVLLAAFEEHRGCS